MLLGPSGCGKSTLLRTVNRLVPLQDGRVLLDEADVASADVTRLRRSIGYAIQEVGLFAHMTVGENVAIVPALLAWERSRVAARIDELLNLVHLDPHRYRDRYPRELSGGEQQRVGVARAIAARPPVLLMDEPFGAVDAIVRASLQEETRQIARTLQTTILFVTHDVDEALRLADRLVVLRDGKVEQYDTPLAILSAPATPYVGRLLDADDVIRRLSLLRVRDAMVPGTSDATIPEIAADASLRDALDAFLSGAETLAVRAGASRIGTIAYENVRRALRAPDAAGTLP